MPIVQSAFYALTFVSNAGQASGGVVVLNHGRIYGGDSGYYYIGSMTDSYKQSYRVKVKHYSGNRNSIFGALDEFEIDFTPESIGENIVFHGNVVGNPNHSLKVILARISGLDF